MHELTIRLDDLGDIARVELPDPRSEQTVRDLLRRAGAATVRIEPFEEDDTAGHGASAALEVVVRIEDDTEGHAMSLRFPTAGEARDFQRRLLAHGRDRSDHRHRRGGHPDDRRGHRPAGRGSGCRPGDHPTGTGDGARDGGRGEGRRRGCSGGHDPDIRSRRSGQAGPHRDDADIRSRRSGQAGPDRRGSHVRSWGGSPQRRQGHRPSRWLADVTTALPAGGCRGPRGTGRGSGHGRRGQGR